MKSFVLAIFLTLFGTQAIAGQDRAVIRIRAQKCGVSTLQDIALSAIARDPHLVLQAQTLGVVLPPKVNDKLRKNAIIAAGTYALGRSELSLFNELIAHSENLIPPITSETILSTPHLIAATKAWQAQKPYTIVQSKSSNIAKQKLPILTKRALVLTQPNIFKRRVDLPE